MAKDSRVTGTNLEQNGWDNKLKRAAEGDDIFSGFRGDIKGEGSSSVLSGSIIEVMKIKGKTSHVMGLIKSLNGSGKAGRTPVAGTEEKLDTLDFTAYGNEWKHGVNADKFGIDAVANEPYALLKIAVPLLGEYMEKYKGTHRREAIIQRVSSNLTVAPSSQAQHINANVFMAGVALASQPDYSDTLATYTTNINTVAQASGSAYQLTKANVRKLEQWVTSNKRIRPISNMNEYGASGKYIVTVPTNQKYVLMDDDTGLGKYFQQSAKPEKVLPGWIGAYGRFVFVEDMRSATATVNPGANAGITFSYTTVDDSRPVAGTNVHDVVMVLGSSTAVELELEALHLEKDKTVEYGREDRTAAFANYGVQLIEWQDGTDVRTNYGSAIVLCTSV